MEVLLNMKNKQKESNGVVLEKTNGFDYSMTSSSNEWENTVQELKSAELRTSPKVLIQKLINNANDYLDTDSTEKKDYLLKQLENNFSKAIYIHSLENHIDITGTVHETYQPLVIELANQVISDFGCVTAHEKALAGIVASSYTRYIQYSAKFANAQLSDSMSKEKTQYYTMFSKEADKAHRQFLSALTVLQQLKSPVPTINVKTNTAFVAQNQQNNAVKRS